MDIEKELKQLKTKIALLESALKKNNLFGSSYSSVGSSSSDYLIKTRGKVKIQIGNTFIDLIKDGKINTNSSLIYHQNEIGSKNGIYVIGDGDNAKVVLVIDGQQIDLKGESGTTYVSFLDEQNATSSLKYTAMKNIGFIYKSINDILDITSGIVYVEEDEKLYIIKRGTIKEYSLEIPNPYTKQFVIEKSDQNIGSLYIKGLGENNSLRFDSLVIYKDDDNRNNIKSLQSCPISFRLDGTEKMVITEDSIICSNKIISSVLQSSENYNGIGYKLYTSLQDLTSTLEIDNIIVRNKIQGINNTLLLNNQWYLSNNIIESIELIETDDESLLFGINLFYENKFEVGDCLYSYIETKDDFAENTLLSFIVEEVEIKEETSTTYIKVKLITETDLFLQNDTLDKLIYQTLFRINTKDSEVLLRISNQNIDLLLPSNFEDESNIDSVITRIGNIGELNTIDNNVSGIYSDNAYFKNAEYTSNYQLSDNDNSSKFASTEWVRKLSYLPIGAIIMFNGNSENIPDSWHICDGTNGTPNLIDKFIKASNKSGLEGGESSIHLSEENLPKHTHSLSKTLLTTNETGNHIHGVYVQTINVSTGDLSVNSSVLESKHQASTSKTGLHSHNIDISDLTLSYTGEGKALEWQPSYYSLIFIMKIK